MPTPEEDAIITAAALSDPDAQPLTEEQLKAMIPMRDVPARLRELRGRPRSEKTKLLVSVRFSPEVISYFKSTGEGWQSRMDGYFVNTYRISPASPDPGSVSLGMRNNSNSCASYADFTQARYPISMTPEQRVSAALESLGLPSAVTTFQTSTHTAQGAADSVGCELGQIVKTLFFLADGRATVVLGAGDRQVDTSLLAPLLGVGRKKVKMGNPEEVLERTGYAVGGVAPVGLATECDIVVDDSLSRFTTVWAAAGTPHSVFAANPTDFTSAVRGQWATITRKPM
jgi:Cys-tRNA(Pro) deacylase